MASGDDQDFAYSCPNQRVLSGKTGLGNGLLKAIDNTRVSSWAQFLNTAGDQPQAQAHQDDQKYPVVDMSQLFLGCKFACGTYSRIYRGQYNEQEVAVKLVRQPEDDAEVARRLDRQYGQEVSLMSRLHHPNVVQFVAGMRKPPVFCVVTEYLPGGSLRAFLHKVYPQILPLEKVLALSLDTARGMEYLHSQGVLHLDLKSPNLVLGENQSVKVTDFGVARHETECLSMTPDAGTYRWMAPELISNKVFSMKADVYSFGIILWEILTGKTPYEEMSTIQAAFAVVHKNVRPIVPNDCPAPLKELMEECWHTSADKRPPFSQVVKRLEEFQGCLHRNETLRSCRYKKRNGFMHRLTCFSGA